MPDERMLWITSGKEACIEAIRQRLHIVETIASPPLHLAVGTFPRGGRAVAVLATGPHPDEIRHAVGILRRRLKDAAAVVSLGLCGALSDELPVGRIILPHRVFSPAGQKILPASGLLDLLRSTAPVDCGLDESDIVTLAADEDLRRITSSDALLRDVAAIDRSAYLWAELCHGLDLRCGVLRGVVSRIRNIALDVPALDGASLDVLRPSASPPATASVAGCAAEWMEALLGVL